MLIDKPSGRTSFQALSALKRTLGTRRVGHTGTLDRFASGLLVVLSGRHTRLAALAEALDAPLVTCDARISRAHGHHARVEVVR